MVKLGKTSSSAVFDYRTMWLQSFEHRHKRERIGTTIDRQAFNLYGEDLIIVKTGLTDKLKESQPLKLISMNYSSENDLRIFVVAIDILNSISHHQSCSVQPSM